MINTIIIHPDIFDISKLSEIEKKEIINNIAILKKQCLNSCDFVILDKQNILKNIMGSYISEETNQEIKKQLQLLFRSLFLNALSSKFHNEQSRVSSNICKKTLSLVKKAEPNVVIFKSFDCIENVCENCVKDVSANSKTFYIDDIQNWHKSCLNYSALPGRFDFSSLVNYLKYDKLVRYCKEFILYDKNIIPETSVGIPREYLYNMRLFFQYFKGTNVVPQIITYATQNQTNDSIKNAIDSMQELARKLDIEIVFKVLSHKDKQGHYIEQIHERYIFTNLINFSIDRGLNIINNNSKLNRSFEISIISDDQALAKKNYLNTIEPRIF